MRSLAKAGMRASVHRCRSEQIVCAPHQQGVGLRDQTGSITVCRVLRQESLVMRCRAPWLSLVYAVSISALFLNCRPAFSPNYSVSYAYVTCQRHRNLTGVPGQAISATHRPADDTPRERPPGPSPTGHGPGFTMVRCNSHSSRHAGQLPQRPPYRLWRELSTGPRMEEVRIDTLERSRRGSYRRLPACRGPRFRGRNS
jgi:hypothetical protein